MNFKKNVGKLDAILRVGIGGAMIYAGFFNADLIGDQIASVVLGVFGAIIFSSGIVSHCPLYNLIGFNSCNHNSE
jgi:hypothetical protein